MTCIKNNDIRAGCKDLWNAFMVKNAEFTLGSDIPLCPCTATAIPNNLISYSDAKHIYKELINKEPDFHYDAFIHTYEDDQKFDGPREGIWNKPYEALEIYKHFAGCITPDFSTNADFPDPIKRYNTYRMRAFGYWLTTNNIAVINNVRWGSEETWNYCFDGIPDNSMVCIGTVASGMRKLKNRPIFERGIRKLVILHSPHTIIINGSSNYSIFEELKDIGINIVTFPSKTSIAYANKKGGDIYE